MALAPESITQPGSGLVFINDYGDGVSDLYRSAVIDAERQLEQAVTTPVTISVEFDLQSLGDKFAAQNSYATLTVGYATLATALRAHATTADDLLAVNGLPATDPSAGAGFAIPTGQATILGLTPQSNAVNLVVTLNSDLPWSWGQDVTGVLEHEITEGAFGRVGSLGVADTRWATMDLFRFTATGQRDYTGGADGQATYFGLDGAHLTPLAYHSSVGAGGTFDGFDLADWEATRGDAFGPSGAQAGVMSATDLQVLDILGWSNAAYAPAADDYASSASASGLPFGQLAVGGAAAGVLEQAGDRDLFHVTLQAGATYRIDLTGAHGGGGTLADPYLRLDDANGTVLATNDDVVDGSNPDSRLVFTAPTTDVYLVEAGGFLDGYAGSYRVTVLQTAAAPSAAPTPGDDVLTGRNGGDSINGLAGNDTITGGDGHNLILGLDGADLITGGPGVNEINGNKGDDTIVGMSSVGDTLFGGQGNDLVQVRGAAGEVINGNLGNDTIQGGAGADTLWGGQGDDLITGGAGNDWLSGDRGHDTVTGGAGADIFHHFAGAGVTAVTDFNGAEGDRVQLDPGSTWTLAQSSADTVIDLGAGSQLILRNVAASTLQSGWIFLA
ncbi:MAG: endo,3,4-beta glycanase [Phenylobacterium sp.]|nr:endo,3,4-beta glycanase [Phenylobacterium sp.]